MLDTGVAVDDDKQLRLADARATGGNRSLRRCDPTLLAFGAVDDNARHFAHQIGTQARHLAVDVDRHYSMRRASETCGRR
ncbi:MAG TPA: hypothetical protein VEQ62_10145 [Stellaceae bacterium]|nr:hypothetical protein [Stellaceae bacterium]